MRTVTYNAKDQLVVEYDKKKILLKNSETTIVKLKGAEGSRMLFKIEGEKYSIGNKGFWKPETVIKKGSKKVMVLRRPITGIVAMAELSHGEVYKCHIEEMPSAKLTFLTSGNIEVLSYSYNKKDKTKPILKLNTPILSRKDLRLLIILGCYCFTGIIRESKVTGRSKVRAGRKKPTVNTVIVDKDRDA